MKLGVTNGVTAGLAILFLSTFAQAQQPAAAPPPAGGAKPQAWQKPCETDVQKLCKDVAAKGGNVPDCLATHEKELSEECTSTFLWRYKVMQDCKDDVDKLCKDKMAAGTSLSACFKEREKDLSEKCRTALVKGSKRSKVEEKTKTADAGKPEEKTETAAATAKPAKKKGARKAKAAQ
jgi:hypothetical protein